MTYSPLGGACPLVSIPPDTQSHLHPSHPLLSWTSICPPDSKDWLPPLSLSRGSLVPALTGRGQGSQAQALSLGMKPSEIRDLRRPMACPSLGPGPGFPGVGSPWFCSATLETVLLRRNRTGLKTRDSVPNGGQGIQRRSATKSALSAKTSPPRCLRPGNAPGYSRGPDP